MSAAVQRPGPGGRISRLVGMVVTMFVLLSALAISAPIAAPVARAAMPVPTGPSWGPCPANGWLSQSAPDPNDNNRWVTRLSSVEVASAHVEQLRSWYQDETDVRQLNAIAFNSQDNYLYGFRVASVGTDNEFVRIDSNSNLQSLELPDGWDVRGLPPQDGNLTIVVGDIDNSGFYWVLVPGSPRDFWVQIRLSDWTVADHGEIDPAEPALLNLGGGADWAYQAGTNYLFRVMRDIGGSNPYLIAFDTVSKTWLRAGLLTAPSPGHPTPPNSQYGAIYAAADGSMYAGNNPTGTIWVFQPGDPTVFYSRNAVQGLSHGEVEGNDAARCNTAVVEVDFGDAPDGYGTMRESDGARHSVLPLAIGSVVDTENDAPAALLNGNGDDQTAADDEDAFGGTIQLGGLGPQSLQVTVINNTDEPATLIGYLDMNQANGFEGSEASNVVTVAPHLTAGHQLTWNLPSVVSGASYVRLRLASGATVAGPTGVVYGGEVEDHPVNFTPPAPTYTVAKTASVPDGDLVPGQEVTYTVTVANTGPVAAPASFTDELADILDDAELIGGPTVNPPNGTAAINGTTLSWSGTLAPGNDSVTVQYTVRVKNLGANGSMPNTVVGGPGSSCGPAPADCTTQHESGWYTVEKWAPQGIPDGATVQPGQQIDYDIYVRGHGSVGVPASFTDDLTDVLDDATLLALPAGVTQVPGNPNHVTWSGTINPGEVRHFVVSVTVDQPPFTGNMQLGNRISGPNCTDPASTAAPCYVEHPVGYYTVEKWAPTAIPDGSTVTPGDEIEYTINVRHHGAPLTASFTDNIAGVLDDATLVTPLPAGLTLNGTTLEWSQPMSGGAVATITYRVRVNQTLGDGRVRNVIVGPNCPANATAAPCVVEHLAGSFSVAKTSNRPAGSTVAPGQTIDYTVTVTRIGEGPVAAVWSDDLSAVLDDATLVTPLPAGVTRTGNTLNWSGTMNVGAAPRTFTYRVTVNQTLGDGVLRNAVVGGNCLPGATTAPCAVQHASGTYTVTKTSNRPAGATVTPGQTIDYTITVTHDGSVAVPATWSDNLAGIVDDATLVTPLPAGVTRTVNTLNWSGTSSPGAPLTFTYRVTVNQTLGDGLLRNAVVSRNCPAGTTAAPCAVTHVAGTYTVAKTSNRDSDEPVLVGQTIDYTVTVTHEGSGSVAATWSDDLSAIVDDATLVTPLPAGVTRTGNTLNWSGTMDPGDPPLTFTYRVTVNQTLGDGRLTNGVVGPNCAATATAAPCVVEHESGTYTVAKTANRPGGSSVAPGQQIAYTVTVTHDGAAPVAATWSDDLSDVLDDATLVTPLPAGVTRTGNTLSWSGTMSPGPARTFTYVVTVNPTLGDGRMTNGIVSRNCPANATAAPCVVEHLAGTYTAVKTSDRAAGSAVKAGDVINYTITVTQDGLGTIPATVTDNLSDVLDDATLVGTPTSGATITGNTLTWNGTLEPGDVVEIEYSVRVTATGGNDRVRNTITSLNCPAGTLTAPCSVTHPQAGYTVAKSASRPAGTILKPGDTIEYTLTLSHFGLAPFTGATLTDNIADVLDDATLTEAPAASKAGLTFAGSTISWTGDLAIGEDVTITYTVQVKAVTALGDGALTNAVVGANCPAGTAAPPCGTDHLIGTYLVTKTGTPSATPLRPGGTVAYTITVAQRGQGAVTGAAITDNLSDVLDDATVTTAPAASAGTASITGNTLSWSGNLAVGATVTITYTVTVKPAAQQGNGQIVNTVTGPNCPSASCTNTELVRAWTVVKSSTPAAGTEVSPGGTIAYRLTIRNTGGLPVSDAAISDSLAGILDDATVTAGPTSGATITGTTLNWAAPLAVDAVVTIDYTVTLKAYAQMGDEQLTNAVVSPEAGCPTPPVTNPASPSFDADCVTNHTAPQLTVAKTSTPADGTNVEPGQTIQYRIAVTNTGTAAIPAATVTDDLSGVLDDANFVGNPVASSGTASRTGNTLTWTGAVPGGATVNITYSVTVKPASQQGNGTIRNVATSPNTPCASAVPGCEVVHLVEAMTIRKASTPATGGAVIPGQVITYTITMVNTGGAPLTGRTFTDNLSDVLDDTTWNAPALTASSGTATFAPTTSVLSWLGNLAVDQTVTVTYAVTVRPAYQLANGEIDNVVVAPDTECLVCGSDLETRAWDVHKVPSEAEVTPGSTIDYEIVVTNRGSTDLTGLSWTDDLSGILDDAELTGAPTADAGEVDYDAPVITWTGDLDVDDTATVSYSARVFRPLRGDRSLTNAVVTEGPGSPCLDVTPVQDRCRGDVPGRELTIEKATEPADREFAEPGDTVFYTLTITNTGAADYTTATATDDLAAVLDDADGPTPAQITVTGPGSASFNTTTGILTWTGPIAIDEVAVVRYAVTVHPVVTGDAHLLNVVTSADPGALCPEPAIIDPDAPGFDPNCVTDTPIKAYEVDKSSDPDDGSEVEPGDTITYTLTLTNTGDVDVNGETVTDDLSNVLDDATLDGDPVASGGEASITDTTLTWSGDIPVGEVITVTYKVIVNPSDELGDAVIGNLVTGTGPSDCAVPPALGPTPDENDDCTTSSNVKAYTIMKSSDPEAGTEIEPGDEVVYSVVLTNTGTVDLTELTVTDTLTDILDDADVTVEPAADAGVAERVDDVLTWTGDLAVEDVVTITYTVTVQPVLELGDGDLRNPVVGDGPTQCVDPVILDEEDPDFDLNCVNIVPIKAYTIVKSSDPADGTTVQPFDRVTYTLTIDNVGTAPLTDLTVTDDLTDVLDDASLDGAPVATGGAAVVDAGLLTWTGGLAVEETVTVTYVAVLNAPTALGNSHLANVVVGTGPTSCPAPTDPEPESPEDPEDPENPEDPEDPEAPAEPEPVVNEDCSTGHGVAAYTTLKEALTPAPRPGEQAQYRLTITSVGSVPILGETISDDLSGVLDDAVWDSTAAYTAGNPATTGALALNGTTFSWTGDIAVDDIVVITYSVTLNPQITGDGWLRNVMVTNDCPFIASMSSPLAFANGVMPPNCRTDTAIPSVAFTKNVSPAGPFKPGDVVTYTITATNNGQANLDGVTWSDDMTRVLDDADLVGQPSADRGAASYSTPIVSWVGSLAVGEVARVTYQVAIRESRGDGSMPNGVIGVGPASNCPTASAGGECQTLTLVLPAVVPNNPAEPGELPRTGGNTSGIVTLAFVLLGAGLALVTLRRRRRRPVI